MCSPEAGLRGSAVSDNENCSAKSRFGCFPHGTKLHTAESSAAGSLVLSNSVVEDRAMGGVWRSRAVEPLNAACGMTG